MELSTWKSRSRLVHHIKLIKYIVKSEDSKVSLNRAPRRHWMDKAIFFSNASIHILWIF